MRPAHLMIGLLLPWVCAAALAAEPSAVAPAPATMSRQGPVDPGALRDLIGKDVRSLDGESIGEIEDVVVLDGNRTNVVVSVGGFLGMGTKLVVLPYDALSMSSDELQVNMTEGQLEQQPVFDPETSEGVSLKRGEAVR